MQQTTKKNTKRRKKINKKRRMIIRYSKLGIILVITMFLGKQIANKVVEKKEQHKQEQLMLEKAQQEEEARKELERQEEEARKELERQEEERRRLEEEQKKIALMGTNIAGKEYTYDAEKLSKYEYPEGKVVFLTFDDGPSTTNTPEILKILEEKDVKATFFITGKTLENGKHDTENILKETFAAGHAIANHSWSHDYSILYPNRSLNKAAFIRDFEKTDILLKEILGQNFYTRVLRCPGGYFSWNNMEELKPYLEENERYTIDWNALNKDAEGEKKNADKLVKCAIETSQGKDTVVMLMHDTYGKEETVKALPQIIDYFKEQGYVFKTIA